MTVPLDDERAAAEWLETDGLGGFASGAVSGIRSRRYHALLVAATTPPTGRFALVKGIEAWLETPAGRFALSSEHYLPDVIHPDGRSRITAFRPDPWPCWTFRAGNGTTIVWELAARHGRPEVALRWRVDERPPGSNSRLILRPLLSSCPHHALQRENGAFDFTPATTAGAVSWRPYPGVPPISIAANGRYRHEPSWYRNFLYQAERERGLDDVEDLASPGCFVFDLAHAAAAVLLCAGEAPPAAAANPGRYVDGLFESEAVRRKAFASPQARAAFAYTVRRGRGNSIIAGYPWVTDWGRDTFIALRGFMTLPGGLDLARATLVAWAVHVSEGMLPNRFPDAGGRPEYNSVDASLWYVIAVHDYLQAAHRARSATRGQRVLRAAVLRILEGYRAGTRCGIHMAADGLIAAGVPGTQLTWMDAKIGERVVTPRIGKPVEIQALWLNALRIGNTFSGDWGRLFEPALRSFQARFWNAERKCLYDVVDVDHVAGATDARLRPNQVFAVGGLPFQLLQGKPALQVVQAVERDLWTPLGLRSLAPGEEGYCAHYRGDARARDSAYHQGTAWPWLTGPFVEAWLRVRGNTAQAKREAGARFLAPFNEHFGVAGLGHISELTDAEAPYRPGGCPFQAWSLGEYLRARSLVDGGISDAREQDLPARAADIVP